MQTLVLGIAGGSGSGKTTISNILVEQFKDHITVINHDNYYKAQHDTPLEERALRNYDHPDAFDTDLMIDQLNQLKHGQTIQCPVYDYTIHDRTDTLLTIHPAPILLVEGILIFENKELCNLMDIKVFVDTDADVRILRRLLRDMNERNRTMESVIEQYLTTVKPMHEAYVEPSKKNADIIIPEGGRNNVAIAMLINQLNDHLRKQNIDSQI